MIEDAAEPIVVFLSGSETHLTEALKARFAGPGKNSMNAEFVDTNILIYAHDGSAGDKHQKSVVLLERLLEQGNAATSIQVLTEFYAAATRKLKMKPEDAEEVLRDMQSWNLHRLAFMDLVAASRLHQRYKVSFWDALILNSALELGCEVLWTEDLSNGQKYGNVLVRTPF